MSRPGVFVLVLCALGLALLTDGMGMAWEKFAPSAYEASIEPVRPGQEDSVKRAVFADGRLWLLSDAGEVWTVREGVHEARREALPEPVFDMCLQAGRPLVVSGRREAATTWTTRAWTGSAWRAEASLASQGDGLVGVQCDAKGLLIVSSRRILELRGARSKALKLSPRLAAVGVSSILATPDEVFVGLNVGEWGGGLRRVDRRTGQVTIIERRDTGEICDGPLNTDCDPVNGLAPEPWKPGCVAVAIGLIHMNGSGRIVEVCDGQVRRLYETPCVREPPAEPGCSEPYFGLVQMGDALWAVGAGAILVLDRTSAAKQTPLPPFTRYGPFSVNFESPHAVLVLTTINQRRAMSAAVPLIVPR